MNIDNKNYILLRKSGDFYHVFDNDALIIKYLFNYKVVKNQAGFPLNSFNKVINTLEEKSINYVVMDGSDENNKSFRNRNKYKKILQLAINHDKTVQKIDTLMAKLESLSYQQLEEVVEVVNDLVNTKISEI